MGREYTNKLANAVVMAFIDETDANGNKVDTHVFAYAPVSFEHLFVEDFYGHQNR